MVDKWLSAGAGAVPPADRAAVESDRLDRDVYDEIVALIGAPRTTGLLQVLAEEPDTRFRHEAETEEDHDSLRFEAHSCVLSAGPLGFIALSDACRALDDGDEGGSCRPGSRPFTAGSARHGCWPADPPHARRRSRPGAGRGRSARRRLRTPPSARAGRPVADAPARVPSRPGRRSPRR